jgi:hypothetical protein
MSFEDVQGTFLSEPFTKNKEFWWSLGTCHFLSRYAYHIYSISDTLIVFHSKAISRPDIAKYLSSCKKGI